MPSVISNSAEPLSVEAVACISAASRIPSSPSIVGALEQAFSGLLSSRATVDSRVLHASSCRRSFDDLLYSCASPRFDSRLYSGTGSGHIRRPAALGLLLRCAPYGFRFLPKQIRSHNGIERRANFFRFPPKKQTFGTWEPGPLPRLRHACPESIREFKTEKQTCI
jgi:hypothetical protein